MVGRSAQIAALAGIAATLCLMSGSAVAARQTAVAKPSVVYVNENTGCPGGFERIVCDGFVRAARRTGVEGRIISPSLREDLADTLGLAARQRYDLITTFGAGHPFAIGAVAPHHPRARFAIIDQPLGAVPGRPPNVHAVVFRASEAAYIAGYLAARMEQRRAGTETVGVVGGFKFPPVVDFVVGFRAGARRASPRVRVLIDYSRNFVDASTCAAIARRQVARGAGVLFNVAGACGLGTLQVAAERDVWGIGVDADQSSLGPHILTSVLKDFGAGFEVLFRRLKAGRLGPGGETTLTMREGAVGLGKVHTAVPAPLRAELRRLERRIASGSLRVPGVFPDPR
jgi:basic membrane protein A